MWLSLISITYLLRVLGINLERTHELLKREQRLSQILRTVTDINQLIVREQDLRRSFPMPGIAYCGRGYSFAWVRFVGAGDNVTLNLAAQAGDDVDPSKFTQPY
ncbi:MAG: hypothetical protein IPO22_14485 [Anaerolineales bacterium]|nr:hypothetical protein [Anaerolineales bacterium]